MRWRDSNGWRTDSKGVAHNKRVNRSRKAAAAESFNFSSVLTDCVDAVTQIVMRTSVLSVLSHAVHAGGMLYRPDHSVIMLCKPC